MAALIATHLKKTYKNKLAVKDISLEVTSNNIVGLLGSNGVGKTICFYMIVGLMLSDNGSVYIDNTDITYISMHKQFTLV